MVKQVQVHAVRMPLTKHDVLLFNTGLLNGKWFSRDTMKTFDLFLREIRFRPAGFLIGLMAAMTVAACLVGARGILDGHDRRTDRLIAALEARAQVRMEQLSEEARVFTKNLGFNILLLPPGQDPGDLYATDSSTHFFASDQANRLGSAKLETLNHLLPMLRQRIAWPAYKGDVILVGVKGEIYIKSPKNQKPMEESIEPGRVHLGDAIHRRINVRVGDSVEILGERFTVHRLLPANGNVDDITVLANLGDVQRLLGRKDKISGILALSCECAAGDLELIRSEVSRTIPGVQVVEFATRARARDRARTAIAKGTSAEMADILASRRALREQLFSFAAILVVLVSVGTLFLLGALAAANTRERRPEVAILRVMGLSTSHILLLFLRKAFFTGLAGGILGCLTGLIAARQFGGTAVPSVSAGFLAGAVALATAVAVLGAIVPAWLASRQDPAEILNRE